MSTLQKGEERGGGASILPLLDTVCGPDETIFYFFLAL